MNFPGTRISYVSSMSYRTLSVNSESPEAKPLTDLESFRSKVAPASDNVNTSRNFDTRLTLSTE